MGEVDEVDEVFTFSGLTAIPVMCSMNVKKKNTCNNKIYVNFILMILLWL